MQYSNLRFRSVMEILKVANYSMGADEFLLASHYIRDKIWYFYS